jgi:hypothetical protein
MSKMGLDGTLLNWPRYIDDQRWFQKHVYPLVPAGGVAVGAHYRHSATTPLATIHNCRCGRRVWRLRAHNDEAD